MFFKTIFTKKLLIILRSYFQKKIRMGVQNPKLSDTNLTVSCEFPVLLEYLRMCDFDLSRTEMVNKIPLKSN